MPQLEVQIMGQSYILGCQEGGEAALQGAVKRVDEAMCRIRDAGKIKARDRIAVLAALNLAASEPAAPLVSPSLAQAAASAASQSAAQAGTATDETTQLRLAKLAAQIDAALGADGQLI